MFLVILNCAQRCIEPGFILLHSMLFYKLMI